MNSTRLWVFEYVTYIPIFIFGLLLNVMALYAICTNLQKWTETTIYMANLAVSDIFLLILLPFKMYTTRYPLAFGWATCSFMSALYTTNTYVSIYTITCISVDRYIAIRHPFRARTIRSTVKSVTMCCVIWTVVGSLSTLGTFNKGTEPNGTEADPKKDPKCFRRYEDIDEDVYSFVFVETAGFVIPLLIVCFCSFRIIQTLHQRKHVNNTTVIFERTIRIIFTNLITFIVCFAPFHAALAVKFAVKSGDDVFAKSLFQVCLVIANTNCCLDGIFYYFAITEFQKNYRNVNSNCENIN